jgi:EmrB/QacA subfamily drug resistance transporter
MCGISGNLGFLIFSRIFQAVGASMFMSSNQGIIASVFPPNERGRALGFSGTTVAIGTMLGPVVGGIMVQYLSWQSIFLINIPIALFGYFAGRKLLPKKEEVKEYKGFDIRGSVLFIIFIVSLFWAVLSGEDMGWNNYIVITALTVSVVSAVAFYFTEKRTEDPMLNFSMFGNRLFTVSLICGFISFIAIFSMNIIHPFFLQYIMNASPAQAGLLMIVSPVCIAVVAPLSGHISDKTGSELLTCAGLSLTAAGLVLISFLNESSSYFDVIWRVAFIGVGNGMFQSPNNSLIMSSVSRDKLGIAGSINALIRNLGMVTGIAFSVALLYNRMSYKMGYTVTSFVAGHNEAFLYGMKVVYISAACICAVGVALTAARMYSRKKA